MKQRVLVGVAAAVMALASVGTAWADQTINQDVPESRILDNPCTFGTEVIPLTGTKHIDATIHDNADGSKTVTWTRFHANTHLQGQVQTSDATSGPADPVGTLYNNNDQTFQVNKQFAAGVSLTIDTRSLLISASQTDNFQVTYYFNIDTTGNLQPVSQISMDCRGSQTSPITN